MRNNNMNNYLMKVDQVASAFGYSTNKESVDKFKKIAVSQSDKKDTISFDCNASGDVLLVPLYDTHVGLNNADLEMVERYINYILETPNCYTVLGGDLLECSTATSVGLAMQEQKFHAGEQRKWLIKKLRPLAEAGKIICGVVGNHEMRARKFYGDEPLMAVCDALEIDYCGYSAYIFIKVGNITYTICTSHGSGSGGTLGGKVNASTKASKVMLADLYLSGHSHTRSVAEDCIYLPNSQGELVRHRRVYVVCGSTINYFDGYAEQMMLAPSHTGLVQVSLSSEMKYISCSF